jgi:hypothetical protein|tara:strand:- start:862 stop:1158 length:297 start_codon:yes stop_codon:yes gene_type:complete
MSNEKKTPSTVEYIELVQDLLTNLKTGVVRFELGQSTTEELDSMLSLIGVYQNWVMLSPRERELDNAPDENPSFSAKIYKLRQDLLLAKEIRQIREDE